MASPQIENGFTKIANELLDAMIGLRIGGQEMRVVLFVARKTYGYGKKADQISYGQIAKALDIPRRKAIYHVQSLTEKNVLYSANNGTRKPLTLWINKDYEQWEHSAKKGTIANKGTIHSANNGTRDSANNGTHKRKKETRKKIFSSDSFEIRLAKYLFNHIRKNNPSAKEPNFQSWANVVDLMIRRDKRDPEEIKTVIEWCQKDTFWMTNILSTAKLREKYDQLMMKMNANKPKNPLKDFDPEEERRKLEEALS